MVIDGTSTRCGSSGYENLVGDEALQAVAFKFNLCFMDRKRLQIILFRLNPLQRNPCRRETSLLQPSFDALYGC